MISLSPSLVRTIRAGVLKGNLHKAFLSRLFRAGRSLEHVVIVSPWISTFGGEPFSLESLVLHTNRTRVPTYIFMRPPENRDQQDAVHLLQRAESVELVYNPHLHAKIYACTGPEPNEFAILGSANMTLHSTSMYEVGLIVLGVGGGDHVVKELAAFGLSYLRTRSESLVVKKRGKMRHDL